MPSERFEAAPAASAGERRAHPRIALSWPVGIRVEGEPAPVMADLRDISCRGAYCFSATPLRCGDVVVIELLLPRELDPQSRGLRVECRSTVVRVDEVQPGAEYGIACAFQDHVLRSNEAAAHAAAAGENRAAGEIPGEEAAAGSAG